MSAVTAVSQRYTKCVSSVRKWCDGGRERCTGEYGYENCLLNYQIYKKCEEQL